MTCKNPFHGRWMIVHTQFKSPENRWETFIRHRYGECPWTFRADKSSPLPDKNHKMFEGKVKECGIEYRVDEAGKCSVGNKTTVTDFLYFSNKRELLVDRRDPETCEDDVYRVARKGLTVLVLYDYENGKDPAKYRYRLILKRRNFMNWLVETVKAMFIPDGYYFSPDRIRLR